MNIPKLKGKMAEKEINVESLAVAIDVDRSTMYRKLDAGEKFTIGEAQRIKDFLELSDDDAASIFFG